jgi:hypothetical protein
MIARQGCDTGHDGPLEKTATAFPVIARRPQADEAISDWHKKIPIAPGAADRNDKERKVW